MPKNSELWAKISAAAYSLSQKLEALDVQSLGISEYNKNYLSNNIKSVKHLMYRDAQLMTWALHRVKAPLDQVTLLEYGGGTGSQSMLARELGVGTVVYNDIYDVSCRDARVIASHVVQEADHYIQGDIDDVLLYSQKYNIAYDAVISYDVIEHMYDTHAFLLNLGTLPGYSLSVALGSGANPFDRWYVERITKFHYECEYHDRERKYGHKERDTLRSYLDARREMIRHDAPDLSDEEADQLAAATRGLIKEDIHKAVVHYQRTGLLPEQPGHPTNTCDPYTGNWAERLMDPFSLRKTLANAGFKSNVFCGGIVSDSSRWDRLRAYCINVLAKYCTRLALRKEGAYYFLYGYRKSLVCTTEQALDSSCRSNLRGIKPIAFVRS
ncbi:class I SAM-dependent methyltransferase [Patescibacteria group bacterium]|nr:class I SAM-dependent methyltransferase [Patescibacteria group bacterium]MBU2259542.1 class I SAM-dependent methyltransferase [Patescibacteria group bacterium]